VLAVTERAMAVIGLGYVGLPLAVALARHFDPVLGFDLSNTRVAELRAGNDHTGEVGHEELSASRLRLTQDASDLTGCSLFFLAVPTPVDEEHRPDLRPLLSACQMVGNVMKPGALVVIESTVYPGLTREVCGPALAAASGLRSGIDFHLGYSPERINPGDKQHRLETIVKVIAAETDGALERLAAVYGAIVSAGLHRAPTIEVAEAAKVIENIQRDVNIALMNELAMIFDQLKISTRDVLTAAGTKWNFLRFVPGLVGGHCIGIDPYYLTARAEREGYHPHVILASRRTNDGMGAFVATRMVRLLSAAGDRPLNHMRVGILGLAFKENVPDFRNSRVPDIIRELDSFGISALVHDPLINPDDAMSEYGLALASRDSLTGLDGLILAVPHKPFLETTKELFAMVRAGGVIADIKAALNPASVPKTIRYWSL
jgi:UDP-N-acetyl-D-galactosamine dehydrogenase